MRAALAALLALALAARRAAAPPKASLPDIEDEVMCVECGTRAERLHSPVAQQERAFIREQIAAGQDQGADQGRAGATSTATRCSPTRGSGGFNATLWIVPDRCSCCSPRPGSSSPLRRWRGQRARRAEADARRRR